MQAYSLLAVDHSMAMNSPSVRIKGIDFPNFDQTMGPEQISSSRVARRMVGLGGNHLQVLSPVKIISRIRLGFPAASSISLIKKFNEVTGPHPGAINQVAGGIIIGVYLLRKNICVTD
jgi:hypothetical protein